MRALNTPRHQGLELNGRQEAKCKTPPGVLTATCTQVPVQAEISEVLPQVGNILLPRGGNILLPPARSLCPCALLISIALGRENRLPMARWPLRQPRTAVFLFCGDNCNLRVPQSSGWRRLMVWLGVGKYGQCRGFSCCVCCRL